jgi:hypothetical protein
MNVRIDLGSVLVFFSHNVPYFLMIDLFMLLGLYFQWIVCMASKTECRISRFCVLGAEAFFVYDVCAV